MINGNEHEKNSNESFITLQEFMVESCAVNLQDVREGNPLALHNLLSFIEEMPPNDTAENNHKLWQRYFLDSVSNLSSRISNGEYFLNTENSKEVHLGNFTFTQRDMVIETWPFEAPYLGNKFVRANENVTPFVIPFSFYMYSMWKQGRLDYKDLLFFKDQYSDLDLSVSMSLAHAYGGVKMYEPEIMKSCGVSDPENVFRSLRTYISKNREGMEYIPEVDFIPTEYLDLLKILESKGILPPNRCEPMLTYASKVSYAGVYKSASYYYLQYLKQRSIENEGIQSDIFVSAIESSLEKGSSFFVPKPISIYPVYFPYWDWKEPVQVNCLDDVESLNCFYGEDTKTI